MQGTGGVVGSKLGFLPQLLRREMQVWPPIGHIFIIGLRRMLDGALKRLLEHNRTWLVCAGL